MMVCEALALLKASGEQFEFQFVGGRSVALPERYDACVQFCKDHGLEDNVSFLGVRSDVPKLLAEWDGFVYATDHDTFGIAVVEAMAAGLPTFVNDWGVMREITHAGEWAHLYDTNNAQLLSSQLEGFISSSEKYRTYATEVANEVRKTYSIEQHAYALNTLYRELFFIKTEM